MFQLYTLFIYCYTTAIRVASLFNPKAALWVKGRKNIFLRMEAALKQADPYGSRKRVWFHCASLGEFEQGRPVIEAYRKKYPDHLIFLTFFSPSGYEVRKNYTGADLVFYLPADTPANVSMFLGLVKPESVFIVKYEYWFNYLKQLAKAGIPVYIISAIFRGEQHFFKAYGGWFRNRLHTITRFFVQDQDSGKLLASIGISNFTLSGDTRFDRVAAIAGEKKVVPLLDDFCRGFKVLITGSSWPEDEKILFSLIREKRPGIKFVIAPHETSPARIAAIMAEVPAKAVRYSEANSANISSSDVLVIDSIGMLSALYRYADVAFIGGGFGAGIHNILEAAAFGVPVIFGPNFEKFKEARELLKQGGAFGITDAEGFRKAAILLLSDQDFHQKSAGVCRRYMTENLGATDTIMRHISS